MKHLTLLSFLCLFPFFLFAQEKKVTKDMGVWLGVNIEKELSSTVDIALKQQLRLYNDVSEVDDYIFDLGGKYKLNKNFKLGANVRYICNFRMEKDAEHNFRYNLDLNYGAKLSSRFKLGARVRYQQEFENYFTEYSKRKKNSKAVRGRLKLRYRYNDNHKWYISGELFRKIEKFKDPYNDKVRFYLGDEFKSKLGQFDCSLGYEKELEGKHPMSFYYLKLNYLIKL
ncbi:DUF2490 domain-containing protein [Prolixibacteraceae bacterium JC049]|nr:DUF2490 domain-containing protein [Prolixibacteraceae bacterium JC049]